MEDVCFEFALHNVKSGVIHFLYDKISSSTSYSLSVVIHYNSYNYFISDISD